METSHLVYLKTSITFNQSACYQEGPSDSDSLQKKLSIVVHQFLTHRQIGESEAFFKILQHLHLKWSNIEAVFIPTGFKKNRSAFLKQITKDEAKNCPYTIKVAGKDGLFIEKPSMLDKFERINTNKNIHVSRLSYLQFNMKYSPTNTKPKDKEFESLEFKRGSSGFDITDEFNLIVTHDFDTIDIHYSLPTVIELKDLKPGEPLYMRRNSRKAIESGKGN